jgi:hypothetical protein
LGLLMPISTNYHNGTPCDVISGLTSYELTECQSSEPRYIRNGGPDILVVLPKPGQTVNGVSSVSLSPNDCMLINPIGTDWVVIMQPTDTLSINQIGYTSGAGGSVAQTTSVNESVTLNKPCGKITMFTHDFSNNDIQAFTMINSFININDVVITSLRNGDAKLYSQVTITQNGSCQITVGDAHNQATGDIAVVLNFAIIKGDS